MSYTVEKIASNKIKLSFVIPAEEFDAALQKAYIKERGRINVPGFRKGKAPRKVIENMYGTGVFYEGAFEECFAPAYDAAIDEIEYVVVDQPEYSVEEIGAGKDLKVTCEVFIRPDVTLGDYKGLTVEIDHQVATDADVEAAIEADRKKQARTVEVMDRPVADGDTVNLDYSGSVDGEKFNGGTAEGQTLKIGSNTFIPGFEAQMVGMCVAEEKDIEVTFPEQYHSEELAGKAAVFHVKVNSITAEELPEVTDEFVADISDFTTVADYRASIVEKLNKEAEQNNHIAGENAVIEKAVENATVEIPRRMITNECQSMLRDMEQRMMYQGIRMDDFLKYTGQTKEQLAASYMGEAEKRVKMQLVLDAIAKAENAEPDEADIAKVAAEMAERMGRTAEDFEKGLNDAQRDALKAQARVQKVVDIMTSSATINDKPAAEAAAEETAE